MTKGNLANLACLKQFPVLYVDNISLNDLYAIIKFLCSREETELLGKTVLD